MIVRIWAWFIIYFTHYMPLSCSPCLTNPLSFPKKMGFDLYPIDFEWVRGWRYKPLFSYVNYVWKILVSIRKQDLDKKVEILWLYQNKVNSSLISIYNCKMVYWTRLSYTESLIVCVLFCLFRVWWLSIFDKYLLVLTEKLQRLWILQTGHNQRLLWHCHLQRQWLWSNLWWGPWYAYCGQCGKKYQFLLLLRLVPQRSLLWQFSLGWITIRE